MLVLLLACFRVVRKCCLLLLLPCQKVEPSCLTKSILFQWFQYSSRSSKMNFLAFIWNGRLSHKWFSIPMYIVHQMNDMTFDIFWYTINLRLLLNGSKIFNNPKWGYYLIESGFYLCSEVFTLQIYVTIAGGLLVSKSGLSNWEWVKNTSLR